MMKLLGCAVAAMLVTAPLAAETPLGDGPSLLDRLTPDQIMRLSTMPPARLPEMQCSALATWLDRNEPRHALALPIGGAAQLAASVSAATANDAELPAELAREILDSLVEKPARVIGKAPAERREQEVGELAAPCMPLFSAARDGRPLPLHPLANSSVVRTALAVCYSRYTVAAQRETGTEVAALNREAAKLRDLALDGKTGTARAAAAQMLAAEAAAAAKVPPGDAESEMMGMIVCQPYLHGLSIGDAGKSSAQP